MLTTQDSTMGAFFENLERRREDDGMCLLKGKKIIRQDFFGSNSLFNGNFDYSFQESAIPISLLAFLRMILEGTNINSESSYAANQAALSLAQLIKFNRVFQFNSSFPMSLKNTSLLVWTDCIFCWLCCHWQVIYINYVLCLAFFSQYSHSISLRN